MRLYARTLLFFVGAIAFQALLTAGLIVGLVSRNNQTAARTELREESVLVYDNYNSWVRAMWKAAIRVRDDEELSGLSGDAEGRLEQIQLVNSIEHYLHDSGMDSFVIRRGTWNHFEIISDAYPYIEDFAPFVMDRDHPYISLKNLEGFVFIVASTRLGPETEVFLLKHIDEDFYKGLTTRDHARVFVSSDTDDIWNTIGDGTDRSAALGLDRRLPPYRELYDANLGRGHYNVSMQNIGSVEDGGSLKLLVFMTNSPYYSLLVRIGRIVFFVSIVTAVLTAGIALLFTGRLTRPIADLVSATEQVREGNLAVNVPEVAMGEIRSLLEGFNSMVRHLAENQVTLDANLREITFLNEYNETIIHSLRAGILVVNASLVVEKANSFYRELFSPTGGEPEGRSLDELVPGTLGQDVEDAVKSVIEGRHEPWSKIRREEDSVWEIKVYPLGENDSGGRGRCVIEMDDISAKFDLEQKILQAEKLSSLSLLSAGIAHEINNPLSTILSNAQTLLSRSETGPQRDALEWIERETRRIATIVRELGDFSHVGEGDEHTENVNECVEEVMRLVQYGMPANSGVRFGFQPFPTALGAAIPRSELRQAVLNILQNAVQAVSDTGEIHLKVDYDARSRCLLSISDSGSGIPADHLGRIFDPFFTTKADGTGTGLGLSIVYGIVKKHGGDVEVKSRSGLGTTFTLILPKCEDGP